MNDSTYKARVSKEMARRVMNKHKGWVEEFLWAYRVSGSIFLAFRYAWRATKYQFKMPEEFATIHARTITLRKIDK